MEEKKKEIYRQVEVEAKADKRCTGIKSTGLMIHFLLNRFLNSNVHINLYRNHNMYGIH